jgi:hypothetical protein
MKLTLKQISKLAWIGLIIGVIGNAVLFGMGISPFNPIVVDETYTAEAASIQELEVSSDSDDIEVKQSADEQFHFRLVGKTSHSSVPNEFNHQLTTENDKLKFTFNRIKMLQIGVIYNSVHLEVSIPKKKLKQLSITSNSGDIKIVDTESIQLSVTNSYGDIRLYNAGGKWTLINGSGDIYADMKAITDDISFKSTFGDFDLMIEQAPLAIQTNLHTNLGEIVQKLPNMLYKDPVGNESNQSGMIGMDGPKIEGSTSFGDISIKLAK